MPNMLFTGVEKNYAIVELVDATRSTNKQIIEQVARLNQSGITEFIFDFAGVARFTSTSLGLMVGIIRVSGDSGFGVWAMRLSSIVSETLEVALHLGPPESRFDGLQIRKLTLKD